jgi:hypothetical protein
MSRKPKKGYFVRGQFVAEGSELDLEYKRELKGGLDGPSRTELKRESTELQELGTDLLTLRRDLMEGLSLPDKLVDGLAEVGLPVEPLRSLQLKVLSRMSTATRYPDGDAAPVDLFDARDCEQALGIAREVLAWLNRALNEGPFDGAA